ncbi:MAG TPA: FKBP-type peptidyl-prolyl cis-trans isomerase [Prevotella sp.]
MKNNILFYLALVLVGTLTLTSCSETDDTVQEYADWQNVNETYFSKLYTATQQKIASGDTSWKILRNWSLPADNEHFKASAVDHVIVHVVNAGTSISGRPLYSDSVRVNYRGRLIPSPSYADGYVFDQSYTGNYNPLTANPASLSVQEVVDGFSTALQNMVIGDRWEIYIPYQLGYGATNSGAIPGYSTLVFDMELRAFSRAGVPLPK